MDDLRPSDYAYRAIRRRFDDLDRGKKGYVEAEDMRAGVGAIERAVHGGVGAGVRVSNDRCVSRARERWRGGR